MRFWLLRNATAWHVQRDRSHMSMSDSCKIIIYIFRSDITEETGYSKHSKLHACLLPFQHVALQKMCLWLRRLKQLGPWIGTQTSFEHKTAQRSQSSALRGMPDMTDSRSFALCCCCCEYNPLQSSLNQGWKTVLAFSFCLPLFVAEAGFIIVLGMHPVRQTYYNVI